MKRLCIATGIAVAFIAFPAPAPAQNAAITGKVITKKKLADCKQQAKKQKLSYGKRRKFVRACVDGS